MDEVKRLPRALIGTLLFAAFSGRPLTAQDSGNIEFHGFVLGNYSGRTTGVRPSSAKAGDFLLAEERVRVDVRAWSNSVDASARVKADFFHDAVDDELDIDLREAYADYTTGRFDFRLGRQIATWGVGDLLFINDVFPKDWTSFFSGRPLEYLKVGVDGFRMRYSSDLVNGELMMIPFYTPDNLPAPDRFLLFDPFSSVTARVEDLPASTARNTEIGLRLYRKIGNSDVSAYAYRGFWRTPGMKPDSVAAPARITVFHPALSTYGASLQGNALAGVLSLEAGYYDSRDDRDGDDPMIPNSQGRFLVGYQKQLWTDATLGAQYYAEIMGDHSMYRNTLPAGFPTQRKYRDIVTLRFEQLLKHQTWKLTMMTFFGRADNDYLLQPQASYKLSDKLTVSAGMNLFGGEHDWTSFGQFDKNDNVYISARFDF
jgi:hypothetical protein